MNIEEILDQIDELLDKAWNLPLAGGRCVVDVEKVREMIDDVRLNLPTEIRQAKAIVSDRADIIGGAKKESETIIIKAQERAKQLVSQDETVKAANTKAQEIMSNTSKQAREMRANARDYSENMMLRVEDALSKALSDVKAGRQSLKSPANNDQN